MPSTVSGAFTGKGVSASLALGNVPEEIIFTISNTFSATWAIEKSKTPDGSAWEVAYGPSRQTGSAVVQGDPNQRFRVRCTAFTSGTVAYTMTDRPMFLPMQSFVSGGFSFAGGDFSFNGGNVSLTGAAFAFAGTDFSLTGGDATFGAGAWIKGLGTTGDGTSFAEHQLYGAPAQRKLITFYEENAGAVLRTQMGLNSANDFLVEQFNAAGASLGQALVFPNASGQPKFGRSGAWSANGVVATTMTSLGPAGSHTTIQEWFTVVNASGVVRYIPAY